MPKPLDLALFMREFEPEVQAPVAPGLVTATTDSRSFVGVARDIYRFQPIVASMREFEMIHGTNEHVTFDNLARLTSFYSQLIATAAR